MAGKITYFLREYVFSLSLILTIIGLILIILSLLGLQNNSLNGALTIFTELELWNAYILIAGLIILAFGAYYQYNYQMNKRFVLKELETNKRSEFCKLHKELEKKVKHLPSEYQKMVKQKEKELNIR